MNNFKILFGKYVYVLAAVTLLGGTGLFAYLESIGLDISCEDKVCEINQICNIQCEVYNPTYQSIYLYNYDDWKITFSPEIVDADVYVKYYNKWRFTNFTRATRLPNIPSDRKYVFVFPRRTTKYFQVRARVSEPARIKWNFGELDPVILSYEYLYENESYEVDKYEYKTVQIPKVHYPKNKSWRPAHNKTIKILAGREIKNKKSKKKIGVKLDKENIKGFVNVYNNTLIKWVVSIGDRNLKEFPMCRNFEKERGVCFEEAII